MTKLEAVVSLALVAVLIVAYGVHWWENASSWDKEDAIDTLISSVFLLVCIGLIVLAAVSVVTLTGAH